MDSVCGDIFVDKNTSQSRMLVNDEQFIDKIPGSRRNSLMILVVIALFDLVENKEFLGIVKRCVIREHLIDDTPEGP